MECRNRTADKSREARTRPLQPQKRIIGSWKVLLIRSGSSDATYCNEAMWVLLGQRRLRKKRPCLSQYSCDFAERIVSARAYTRPSIISPDQSTYNDVQRIGRLNFHPREDRLLTKAESRSENFVIFIYFSFIFSNFPEQTTNVDFDIPSE